MTAPQAPERRTLLLVMLAAVSLALAAILWPFSGTLLWSVIMALLFTPLHRRLVRWLNGRQTLAAGLTMAVIVLIVVLPFAALTAGLVDEITALYAHVQSGEIQPARLFRAVLAALPAWMTDLLSRFGLSHIDGLQQRLLAVVGAGSQFIATQALRVGQNTFELMLRLLIMLYVAFFLIRDGDQLVRALRLAVPLSSQHQRELTEKFTTVIRATVRGNVLVAALQGALGAAAFAVLGIQGVLLWGVLMAFLSLLPTVGAALVWLPVALYLLSTGAVFKGVALIVWGALVIGLVDNLLRPVLVGKDTRLPDFVVLITTLGGMSVFGINGFVLGPVIAAMFFAVWHIAVVRRAAVTQEPSPVPAVVPAVPVVPTVPAAAAGPMAPAGSTLAATTAPTAPTFTARSAADDTIA